MSRSETSSSADTAVSADIAAEAEALARALERLAIGLMSAADQYDQAERSQAWDHGRSAARLSLKTVIEFVDSVARLGTAQVSGPLFQLLLALEEADSGIQHPMLKHVPVGGRPKEVGRKEILKAYASAVMTALMQAKRLSKRAAAELVARTLADAGYRLPGRGEPPTSTTIINWRDKFIGQVEPGRMTNFYRKILAALEELPPETQAQRALDVLKTFVREQDLQKPSLK